MKKYSKKWKVSKGSWVQPHKSEKWGKIHKIHWIENGTEYSRGEFLYKRDALDELN